MILIIIFNIQIKLKMDVKDNVADNSEGDLYENRKRKWDHEYNNWLKAGMPEDDKVNPKPGKHPDGNHQWNTD